MYLARETKSCVTRFCIRHSFAEGGIFISRTLFDLGTNPSKYIIYPGGNGYYFDPIIEDAIEKKGMCISQDDLEPVFWEFLDPAIKRVVNGFRRTSSKTSSREKSSAKAKHLHVHMFDKRRLHYLKFACMDQRQIHNMPETLYKAMYNKSRDEIEQYFITAEAVLNPGEYAGYIFTIFDLQKHFTQSFKRHFPAGLDQKKMDEAFIGAVCGLSRDSDFWEGMPHEDGLRTYLIKYVVTYFDHDFPSSSPMEDYINAFRNRHRAYRSPEKIRLKMEEAACLFGVDRNTLNKMDAKTLTRCYRQLAMKHHPDTGGEKEAFVKLTAVYKKLMKKKNNQ